MSSRSGKKQPTKLRGPSRPVDPRYVPGARRVKSGPDSFGLILLGVSAAFVVLVILFVVLQNRGATTADVTNPVQDTGAGRTQSLDPAAQATGTVAAFLTVVADVPRIPAQEVRQLQEANDVTIFDVMSAVQYANSHVAGAKNIPLSEIMTRAAEIPKSGNVVIYCECPNDEEGLSAAKSLTRSLGYTNVRVMQGPRALTLWKSLGYPVEGSGS